MKICKKCNNSYNLDLFFKNKSSRDGHYSVCKICKKTKNNDYKKDNIIREIVRNQEWYKKNKDKKHEYYKEYYEENKYRYHYANIKRMKIIKKATIKGFDNEIKEIYKNRPSGYHVDHIIPLQGEKVSGLHAPWNLQYLLASENLSKGNKYKD